MKPHKGRARIKKEEEGRMAGGGGGVCVKGVDGGRGGVESQSICSDCSFFDAVDRSGDSVTNARLHCIIANACSGFNFLFYP